VAGTRLGDQLRVRDPLPVGAAVVTDAGELAVEFLVHAVVSSKEEPVSRATVRRALTSALHRVVDWQIKEIIIAPFGLGAGNLDIEDSAEVMTEVLARHLERARFPTSITVVVETEQEAQVVQSLVRREGL
jgi:O-acetyl-ADP-ribose deacetylase (regulator of RNase III)